jgi:hypothetical protein
MRKILLAIRNYLRKIIDDEAIQINNFYRQFA